MDFSVMFLGVLVGMAHALEPDHLAAVGALASGKNTRGALVLRGAAWGLGHTITLALICSAVILFGMILTDRMAAILEGAVGVMLVLLGVEVLYRLRKAKMHFHVHQHHDGQRHFHAHSHLGELAPHDARRHNHTHSALPVKALFVGLVHGAAGSAGLLALAIAAVPDPRQAILYVLLFGVGSILGMASLSFVASWPLALAERYVTHLYYLLRCAVGVFGIALGVHVLVANAAHMLG